MENRSRMAAISCRTRSSTWFSTGTDWLCPCTPLMCLPRAGSAPPAARSAQNFAFPFGEAPWRQAGNLMPAIVGFRCRQNEGQGRAYGLVFGGLRPLQSHIADRSLHKPYVLVRSRQRRLAYCHKAPREESCDCSLRGVAPPRRASRLAG